MSDTQQQQTDETSPETQQNSPESQNTPGQATGKVFTQAELDQIVQERLARERNKYANYEELKKAADELKKIREANQSETERLTNRLAELERERADWERERQEHTVRYEVMLAAGRLGIVDPEAAYKLLDLSQIEYAGNGMPKNIEQALKDLLKAKPYLVRHVQPANINADDGRGSTPPDPKAREAELRKRFRI